MFRTRLSIIIISSLLLSCHPEVSTGEIPTHALYTFDCEDKVNEASMNFKAAADQKERNPNFDYQPGYVSKPPLYRIRQNAEEPIPTVEREVILICYPSTTPKYILKQLKKAGIQSRIVGYLPTFDLFQLELNEDSPEIRARIKEIPGVEEVHASRIRKTDAIEGPSPSELIDERMWHLETGGIPAIWEKSTGNGVKVAVIDTGIAKTIGDFAGRIIAPWSVVTRSHLFEDQAFFREGDTLRVISHGTAVASVIAGMNSYENRITGVAPGAQIMPIQVFGYSIYKDRLVCSDLAIIEGIGYAIEMQADIINMSLGTDYSLIIPEGSRSETIPKEVYQKMKAYATELYGLYRGPLWSCSQNRVAVVVSAGNQSISAEYDSLASSKLTIAVGALDRNNTTAAFSNFGKCVNAYAPGVSVPGIAAGGDLRHFNGTSFSAPYLAGVLALALEVKPEVTPLQITSALSASNQEVRDSLFPDGKVQLFSPALFCKELDIDIEIDEDLVDATALRFSQEYSRWFISESDGDEEILAKILGYYAHRRQFSQHEREAKWAISHAVQNFDYLLNIVSNPNHSQDYYAARILARAKLSPGQIKRAAAHIPDNDMASLLCYLLGQKEYLPQYLQRLEQSPVTFNGNTLFAINDYSGRETLKNVTRYLKRVHNEYPTFQWDEGIACYVMINKSSTPTTGQNQLLDETLKRLKKSGTPFRGKHLSQALVKTGNPEGVRLIVDQIRKLEAREFSDEVESTIRGFQKTLNTSIVFSVVYNYDDPPEKRVSQLDQIEKQLGRARFVMGKFVSN